MPVLDLTTVPKNIEDWAQWSFSNVVHHRDIVRVIFETRGKVLDEYVIDPINFPSFDNWLAQHSTMHQQATAALGIASYDLQQVDLDDPDNLQNWINLHVDEHRRIGAILNLE